MKTLSILLIGLVVGYALHTPLETPGFKLTQQQQAKFNMEKCIADHSPQNELQYHSVVEVCMLKYLGHDSFNWPSNGSYTNAFPADPKE